MFVYCMVTRRIKVFDIEICQNASPCLFHVAMFEIRAAFISLYQQLPTCAPLPTHGPVLYQGTSKIWEVQNWWIVIYETACPVFLSPVGPTWKSIFYQTSIRKTLTEKLGILSKQDWVQELDIVQKDLVKLVQVAFYRCLVDEIELGSAEKVDWNLHGFWNE